MRRTTSAALGLGVAIASSSVVFVPSDSAQAAPIPYTFQLQARASVGSGATTFNLPSGSAFSSATPDINNNRRVTFKPLLKRKGLRAVGPGRATVTRFNHLFPLHLEVEFDP